ncbi:MAG: XdhC family protein [Bacteroidales bacterium]|nr:XdhC family protein [Bacteroidales bacterium]MBN2757546.1 XdhC family protein [Bacteroidales bacterium]
MNIWNFVLNKLADNKDVMFLAIVESNGSSPGRQGFKMAVSSDNQLFGSIGGGVMEFEMVELSKKLLKSENFKPFLKHQIHKDDAEEKSSGMICSGNQYIAFYPLNIKHLSIFEEIANNLKSGNKTVLTISNDSFKIEKNELSDFKFYDEIFDEQNWIYKEQIAYENIVYIIGAGHVGLALSETMKQLDFQVIAIDNRENLNTYESNTYADIKAIINYNDINEYVKQGDNIYVVIMTFSHAFDKLILGKLVNNKYAYLGLMGSTKKIETIKQKLIQEGVTSDKLNEVYAPIGIKISSKTPAEIAISIAAEIIKIKNSDK